MGQIIDLTGQRFGKLIAQYYIHKSHPKNGKSLLFWHCKCDCGNELDVITNSLRKGNTKSCGCLQKEIARKQNFKNLVGEKFGKLTVLERAETRGKKIYWLCQCDCGNIIKREGYYLKSGKTTSCGCSNKGLNNKKHFKDLTGQKFGRLTPVKRVEKNNKPYWLCNCDCGNDSYVTARDLMSGHTKSCGCFARESASICHFQNLQGRVYGKLTVLHRVENYISPQGIPHTQWLCKCECGNECIVSTIQLNNGRTMSCGCIVSKGENLVSQHLNNLNYKYQKQKRFDDLRGINNGKLSYDFYIPSCNILIEVQGEQHEKPVGVFGGEEQFIKQQEHDRRKREYAKNNGYRLLEIWYYDFDNIEEILNKELKGTNKNA